MEATINKLLNNLLRIEFALALILLISLVGLAIPYGFPIFLPLVILYFTKFFLTQKLALRINLGFLLLYLGIVFYLTGILHSGGTLYELVKVDLANLISIAAFLPMVMGLTVEQTKRFIDTYNRLTGIVIFLIACFSLYKYYRLLQGEQIGFLVKLVPSGTYPWGTSLIYDYNMFAYAMFAGLFASAYCLSISKSFKAKIFYLFTLFIILISIIFAGSRRGWTVLALLLFCVIVSKLSKFFIQLIFKRIKIKNLKTFVAILIGSLVIAFIYYSVQAPTQAIHSYEFTKLIGRFSTIFGENANFFKTFSDRFALWEYAESLIVKYSKFDFLFGNGFDYLPAYGTYATNTFLDGSYPESYPHNPIISAIHYSGIIGAIVVSGIIIQPLLNMYMKRKLIKKSGFISLYIVSLLFLLPAANTIFSIKPFLLLIGIGISLPHEKELRQRHRSGLALIR